MSDVVAVGVIFFAVLAVYWPARTFDWINLDDPQYVFGNETVLTGLSWHTFKWAFTSTTGGLWQPMTMLSLLLDVRLHGPNAGPMHLENVLLHACSSVGWYILLRGITGRKWPAFFTAAIFGLHPARVESVAWITERKDVLSMFMLVLSLIAWWRFARRFSVPAYLLSLGLFCLALMSKAMVVSQPVLMLLMDVWPLGRTFWWRPRSGMVGRDNPPSPVPIARLIVEKLPFILLSAINSIIALRTQTAVGARSDWHHLPWSERLTTMIVGYANYLGELFWPRHLAVFYPYQHHVPLPLVIVAAVLLMMLTAIIVRFGKNRPFLLVGWTWFILALVPVSGLFQAGMQAMADRFSYLPSVGLTFAVVWFAADSVREFRSRLPGMLMVTTGVAALLALSLATREYLNCWHDSAAVFTRASQVRGIPRDSFIETHLADGLVAAGDPVSAMDHYQYALDLDPNVPPLQINLGNLLMKARPDMALEHYKLATLLKPRDAVAHYDYAVCLKTLHQDAEADREFELARQFKQSGPPQ